MPASPRIRFDILGNDRASPALRNVARVVTGIGRGVARLSTGLARTTAGLAVPAAGLATGLGAGLVLLNQATVRSQGLAAAVRVSADTLEGLADAVSSVGFESDNVVDLLEEMNNKFGESAGLKITGSTADALKILGVRFKELKKLQPEQQFFRIADAILKLPDGQKAVSAADILLGGEANKIFGALRAQGTPLQQIIADYKALNVQTETSRRGAQAFASQWARITTVISTGLRFAAGEIGAVLEPELIKLSAYLTENRGMFRKWVGEIVKKVPEAFQKARDTAAEFGKFWWKNGDQIIATALKVGEAIVTVATAINSLAENAARFKGVFQFGNLALINRAVRAVMPEAPTVSRVARPEASVRANYVTQPQAQQTPAKAEVTVSFKDLPNWAQVTAPAPKGPVRINLNQGFAY
jgi:hypothetical protein